MRYLLAVFTAIPMFAFPMSIRVNVDVNIMNGDGTINDGNNNESEESRDSSGSNREDSSDSSKNINTQSGLHGPGY